MLIRTENIILAKNFAHILFLWERDSVIDRCDSFIKVQKTEMNVSPLSAVSESMFARREEPRR